MHPTSESKEITRILITEEQIAQRVAELGAAITADYQAKAAAGERIVVVGILRGASIFMADLVRQIELPVEMDFMVVSSYGASTKSSGEVTIKKDLGSSIEGAHVIIVEDIIDTGLTLKLLRAKLLERKPLSVEIAAFLRKDVASQENIECAYVGFPCPNEFIVGYGLDYAEQYRNLADVCILAPEMYA